MSGTISLSKPLINFLSHHFSLLPSPYITLICSASTVCSVLSRSMIFFKEPVGSILSLSFEKGCYVCTFVGYGSHLPSWLLSKLIRREESSERKTDSARNVWRWGSEPFLTSAPVACIGVMTYMGQLHPIRRTWWYCFQLSIHRPPLRSSSFIDWTLHKYQGSRPHWPSDL